MKRSDWRLAVTVLSAVWGSVVTFFVWTVLSIDQNDISISPGSLANAAGSQAWQYLLVFIGIAFAAWAIPTALAWRLTRKIH